MIPAIYLAFLLLTLAPTPDACKFLDGVQQKLADFHVAGTGFHRHYHVNVKLSSMDRFMDCSLATRVTVPKGAYVDTVGLEAGLLDECFAAEPFDIEQPAFSPNATTRDVYFYQMRPLRKVFNLEANFRFPIHIRYHKASSTGEKSTETLSFRAPEVFVSCKDNKTSIFADKNCERFVEKIPCGCGQSQKRCEFIRIGAQPGTPYRSQQIQVPIGNATYKNVIVVATLTFVGALILALVLAVRRTGISVNKSNAKQE